MQINLEKQVAELIKEYSSELREDIERALTDAANVAISELKLASPIGNTFPHFRDQWEMKTQYKGVRYVGNSKTVSSKKSDNIPLANILEYGPNAKPFIAKTFDLCKGRIYQTFLNSIKGGF